MSGEELYKEMASSGGVGLRELAAKPDQYSHALKNNEVLHPQDLEGFNVTNSALSILEGADALARNGGPRSYEVTEEYSEEEIDEAFERLEEFREHLF